MGPVYNPWASSDSPTKGAPSQDTLVLVLHDCLVMRDRQLPWGSNLLQPGARKIRPKVSGEDCTFSKASWKDSQTAHADAHRDQVYLYVYRILMHLYVIYIYVYIYRYLYVGAHIRQSRRVRALLFSGSLQPPECVCGAARRAGPADLRQGTLSAVDSRTAGGVDTNKYGACNYHVTNCSSK